MKQVEFAPNHRITVATDDNHAYVLYCKNGIWQATNILFQCNLKDSSTCTGADRLNYCKEMALEIQKSDFVCIVLDKLISAGLKFYVELQESTGWIQLGIRSSANSSIVNWFTCMTGSATDSFAFNHSYNQAEGKTNKGYKHGQAVKEQIEKKIGIKFSQINKN